MICQVRHGGHFLWTHCPELLHKFVEHLTGLVLIRVPARKDSATYYVSSQYPPDWRDVRATFGEEV